jgi:5-methylcytosine-specific restriction endonuclease McrA
LECKYAWISQAFAGENSWNWKGGPDEYPKYYGPNWKRQSRRARKRDGYKCRHCGITQEELGRRLSVHHIIPFRSFDYVRGENNNYKQANLLTNLISLCPDCHRAVHHKGVGVQPNLL